VLAEMHELGLRATEAGPEGYLGTDPQRVREQLERYELELVGGFLPVVLHDPGRLDVSLERMRATTELFAELGGSVVCSAAVVDDAWSPRVELSAREWRHLLDALARLDELAAAHGVLHVLHPHWGTLVERDEDVQQVLEGSAAQICLDTGHLTLGGSNPLALCHDAVERIGHVHLKDVDERVAARLRAGAIDLVPAVQAGLYRPLGRGGAPVREVLLALQGAAYEGWYVLEQDTAIASPEAQPAGDVRRSIEFLESVLGSRLTVNTKEGVT
jgi:inosose dehydratase